MMCSLLLKSAKDKKMGSFMRASEGYYQRIVSSMAARCALCFDSNGDIGRDGCDVGVYVGIVRLCSKGFFPVQDTERS